jgi:hypothetical protein
MSRRVSPFTTRVNFKLTQTLNPSIYNQGLFSYKNLQ